MTMIENDETLLCVTHYWDVAAPCFVPDKHFAACESDDCTGCVPRKAEFGMLCSSCHARLERARSRWSSFMDALGGEARAVQPDPASGSGRPGARIPLTALQLTIDEISRMRPDAWTEAGAVEALQFSRAVDAAVRAFPTRDMQRRIQNTRCPRCKMRTLVYEPTRHAGGEARVRCLGEGCGKVMDHSAFERIALIEAQCCRRCRHEDGCGDLSCTCHRVAPVAEWQRTNKPTEEQPYSPASSSHSDLDVLMTRTVADLRSLAIVMELPRARTMRKPELVAAIREAE
jgi:hypothetical protein